MDMEVVYSDGTKGTLSAEQSKDLYLRNRWCKKEFEKLEEEMNRLNIIKFYDSYLKTNVSIEYVRGQVFVRDY